MDKNNNLLAGKGESGQWVTVKGAHIFIEEGKSVKDAINEKFNKDKDLTGDGDITNANKNSAKEEESDAIYDAARKDKYGNSMLSKKYRDIAKRAGQEYADDMTKYYPMDTLINSNVFPGYLRNKICDAVCDASGDAPDITNEEIEQIITEITGYKFNYDAYENGGSSASYFTKIK